MHGHKQKQGLRLLNQRRGLRSEEAQENYVPALSAHEQALLEHAAALNKISQDTAAATDAVNQDENREYPSGVWRDSHRSNDAQCGTFGSNHSGDAGASFGTGDGNI